MIIMTEQEAKVILDVRISRFDHAEDVNEALEIAKQVLEEIQQYRAIGTVEECRAYKRNSWIPVEERLPEWEGKLVSGGMTFMMRNIFQEMLLLLGCRCRSRTGKKGRIAKQNE